MCSIVVFNLLHITIRLANTLFCLKYSDRLLNMEFMIIIYRVKFVMSLIQCHVRD